MAVESFTKNRTASSMPAGVALLILLLVYIINFTDRILIVTLFTPLKDEFSLTNFEVALLGTTSFILFYTLLGIPFGYLADRIDRVKFISIGLITWCVFSGLSGFAETFWHLFLCRIMVGVGEATLGPAALSLISVYFNEGRRATVQSIFSTAIAFGTAVAFFLGPMIEAQYGWRYSFIIIGFGGLILVPFVLLLPEPRRDHTEPPSAKRNFREAATDYVLFLQKTPAMVFHNIGYALLGGIANSLTIWVPVYLALVLGLSRAAIGVNVALSVVFAGISGTLLGGLLADWAEARRKGGRLRLMGSMALLMAPLYSLLLMTEHSTVVWASYTILIGFSLAWLGVATSDVHRLAPPNVRGLSVGVYYFVVNWICYGIVPPLIGALADIFGQTSGSEGLKNALIIAPLLLLLSAGFLFGASSLSLRESPHDSGAP